MKIPEIFFTIDTTDFDRAVDRMKLQRMISHIRVSRNFLSSLMEVKGMGIFEAIDNCMASTNFEIEGPKLNAGNE